MDKWIRFRTKKGWIILEEFKSFTTSERGGGHINGFEISAKDAAKDEHIIAAFVREKDVYLNLATDQIKNTKGD